MMSKTFEAFKYRDYRLLWIGNLCTTIAVWIQTTTMSWVSYSLTGTGSTIGVVNAMRMFPTLTMTPIAGVAVDRFNRNKIIAISQPIRWNKRYFSLSPGIAVTAPASDKSQSVNFSEYSSRSRLAFFPLPNRRSGLQGFPPAAP